MARVNIDILGNQLTKMDWNHEFNSDDHYIYYCGQESLEEMEEPSWSTKESKMQYLICLIYFEMTQFIFNSFSKDLRIPYFLNISFLLIFLPIHPYTSSWHMPYTLWAYSYTCLTNWIVAILQQQSQLTHHMSLT